jgi:hypothetical protein
MRRTMIRAAIAFVLSNCHAIPVGNANHAWIPGDPGPVSANPCGNPSNESDCFWGCPDLNSCFVCCSYLPDEGEAVERCYNMCRGSF